MNIPASVDVVIVGAGPAGLATACVLRQNKNQRHPLDGVARATLIHAHTLEVLEHIGVAAEILEQGNKVTDWDIRHHDTQLAALSFETLDSNQRRNACYAPGCRKLGGKIYRDAKVTHATDSGDAVKLEVSTPDTKTTVTAKYAVAADGLHSTIRDGLGIDFEGGEYSASFVAADTHLKTSGALRPNMLHLWLHPDGLMLFIPKPKNVWRIVATVAVAPKNADLAFYQDMVASRGLSGIEIEEVVWQSRFHIHHRLAKQYRKGRIFLAGDAAHVHSPAGGQGMNTGISDGFTLGQVLSEAITNGKESDAALKRYESERRPVAKGVVDLTHRITVAATLKSQVLTTLRNWMMWAMMSVPMARAYLTHRLSQLEH